MPDASIPAERPSASISADAIRLPTELARQLCAAHPEALAALCRVLWFARVAGICFAAFSTLRLCGLPLSAAVLRRGLVALLDRGLLASGLSTERATVSYQPTDALPTRPVDSVFIPPEVWRGCKPTEIAAWVVWRLARGHQSTEQLGQQIAGRGGKHLSRRQAYAVFSTLRSRGLAQCDGSAKNEAGGVRKTRQEECEKQLSNTKLLNTDSLNTDERSSLPRLHCSCGQLAGVKPGSGFSLSLLPVVEPSAQLSFPFAAPLRLVTEVPVLIDWLEVCGEAPRGALSSAPAPAAAPPASERPRSPSQPPQTYTFPGAVRALLATSPSIQPPREFPSPTGLHPQEEAAIGRGWQDAAKMGYALADLTALSEYVNAGGIERRSAPRQWLCQNLCTTLLDAEQWRKSGRPLLRDAPRAKAVRSDQLTSSKTQVVREIKGIEGLRQIGINVFPGAVDHVAESESDRGNDKPF